MALLQVLDLLNSADDITARHGGHVSSLATYAALRLPQIINLILPFAMLMAALLCLARLVRGNEIIALKAGGFSFYRLLLAFVPATFVVGVFYFIVNDQLVPWSTKTLATWDAAPAPATVNSAPVWLRDGRVLVGVDGVAEFGHLLTGVRVFDRDEKGILTEQIIANRAMFRDGHWYFQEAWRFQMEAGQSTNAIYAPELPWSTSADAASISPISRRIPRRFRSKTCWCSSSGPMSARGRSISTKPGWSIRSPCRSACWS